MHFPEIDLPKMAGVAGSAIGLIIATCIFLSWVSARYIPVFERLRALTGELRICRDETKRRVSLRSQINDYRRRLFLMNRATCCLCLVMIAALTTTILASAAVVLPPKDQMTADQGAAVRYLSMIGSATLLIAFTLDAAAVVLMITENRIDRRAIESEVADLDEVEGG